MKRITGILTIWLAASVALSQKHSNETNLHTLPEEIIADPDEDVHYEQIYENLLQILSTQHDLNLVSKEELQLLHILTDAQIESFLSYRKEYGDLLDIHELQAVPGFDVNLINKLLPFLKVTDPDDGIDASLISRMLSDGNNYLLTRYERTIEKKNGFKRSPAHTIYAGSADKMYLRFRSSLPGHASVGLTAEKDAGERILFDLKNKQWGFDFVSWHLQLRNKGRIKNIILGDFQMQFGQGLMFGGAFGLGKGGESIATLRRSNIGFLPYTSTNESAYQRGIATTMAISRNATLSMFYSRAARDAATTYESDSMVVRSFPTTGYHRTEAELAERMAIAEQNTGVVFRVECEHIDAGLLLNATKFDAPVRKDVSLYNQTSFTGSGNMNAGVFVNYTLDNISIFSEATQSIGAGRAILVGLLISLSKNFELSMLSRNYARDYHSFYANAFAENTAPQNEKGVYWGWKYRWNRRVALGGYVDLFTFPWLAFRRYSPSDGYEWLLKTTYRPTKSISLSAHFREESKQRNLQDNTIVYKSEAGIRTNAAIDCDYGIGERIRLRSRILYNSYQHHQRRMEGVAVAQDVTISAGRFKFTGRHALFDADTFDNRHYIYESDVWLSYSLPGYSKNGVRNYALFEIKVHKNLTLWLRYARTRLANETEIGSGSEAIEGNTRNDVKFQARYRF